MNRMLLGWLPGLTLVVFCAPFGFAADTPEDKKLEAHFKAWLRHELDEQPALATRLGDHRNAAQLERDAGTSPLK